MTSEQTARERAQDTAGTAADEGKHVAGTARDEAQRVASEAATQARGVLDDARTQVNEQSAAQKDRLASTLRTFGDDLGSMAENGSGLAGDLARQVSTRAQGLGAHLEGREPAELLDDVRRFARERPGTFLIGALVAGVVVGRLARGTADGINAAEATPAPAPVTTPPAPVAPVAAPALPVEPPMATPAAGYGERGVLGEEDPR